LPSDNDLLAQHIAGEPGRFEVLVDRYCQELFQFLWRFTGSRALAEDASQEAFLQVHLSASSFDFSRRFKPWLFTIAANKARDMLRAKARRPEMALDAGIGGSDDTQSFASFLADDQGGPPQQLEEAQQQEIVRQVVSSLPDNLREILALAYFHQLPYKEVAQVLDIPLGTVKSRLHAAVAAFGHAYRARLAEKE